ncbi:FtsK/SpoIIIE domain-containing protein [Mobilicoccus pelagius]|uniref:FtsK/SpoIIIE domain-containing protein n=1 Tax=Mobilicoccus pelagius TaxID=746032 RepID=UPI000309E9FB|nr:FtsK/SpoIIIE domain-containing protein [Mobilicoccus pelagius]
MVSHGVRGLVGGPDGEDLVVRAAAWDLPVPPGGVLDPGCDLLAMPFGVVELVVEAGLGAGSVHRLDVGTYRCGPAPEDDVRMPSGETWTLDVRCGGEVVVEVGGERWQWRLDETRRIAGVDVQARWCRGPAAPGVRPRPLRGRSLADVLLDRVAGVPLVDDDPTWHLGRPAGDPTGWVAVPLAEEPVLVVGGRFARAAVRGLLGRVLATDPRLRVTLLAPGLTSDLRATWAWLRWLPQARCGDERFVRVGFDEESCARWSAELAARGEEAGRPDLVVVDGHVADVAALARPGLAAVVVDDGLVPPADGTPAADAGVLMLDVPGPRARLIGLGGRSLDTEVDLPETGWADRLARTLSRATDETPPAGRLLDLLGVDARDVDALVRRWQEPPTARVPLGTDPDVPGVPVVVDLAADGPHALVGGTTGAGKSELLQTLVAGLALANPPSAMSFLLVDYKGGAAFAACAGLPHTVGVVTDLDAALTRRALASLSAEIRRRERLLADAGAVDLAGYLAAGHGPLARLVIVVDEFATLAAELPEFVDGLVDIARRGRSLGLHLVLATQRPAGAVSADIRANTTLRIALRVAEAADSVDVIGVPDAVTIPEASPGRALVRVGQNPPVALRTARVTTPGPATEASFAPYEFGEPLSPPLTDDGRPSSDLAVLAATTTAAAERAGLALPPRPWLPPLPATVDLAECEAQAASDGTDGSGGRRLVPFGLEDRPERQQRSAAVLDLDGGAPLAVVGGARSGRSSLLATLAASVAARLTLAEAHVHAIDAGAQGLAALEGLPGVGVVAGRDDPGRVERLVVRLTAELDRRLQRLGARRWRDAAEQRVEHDPGEAPWPSVLLLVDRWDLLTEAAEISGDRATLGALERLATEGGRAGILVVASGDRTMLTGRLTSVFPDRLVLRLADLQDYLAVGLPGAAGHGEPGRGWRGADMVETQAADVGDLLRLVGALPDGLGVAGEGGPFRIDRLPGFVTRADVPVARADAGSGPEADGSDEATGAAGSRVSGDGTVNDIAARRGFDRPLRLVSSTSTSTSGETRESVPAPIPFPTVRGTVWDVADDRSGFDADAWSAPPAPLVTPRRGDLLVAVGGDELGPMSIDADEHGPCALVTGRRRSGRSGVLLTLVESALLEGWEVVVVTARRSPLLDVPARTGGRVHGPVRRDEDAERMLAVVDRCLASGRRMLLVADDVDLLPDGELLDALGDLPGMFRDSGSLFVASSEAEEIVGAFRGPAPMLRRARCGVMLAPQGPEDGEAFGVRLRRAQYGPALPVGAGYLVLDGLPERVQVVRSSFFPEP